MSSRPVSFTRYMVSGDGQAVSGPHRASRRPLPPASMASRISVANFLELLSVGEPLALSLAEQVTEDGSSSNSSGVA